MNLHDIYLAQKLGVAPDLHTKLIAEWLPLYQELAGALPLSFTAKGLPLVEWSITGNTVQDGTPTPDNPVEVLWCGDWDTEHTAYKIPIATKGKNLFDYKTMSDGQTGAFLNVEGKIESGFPTWAITKYIPCTGNVFTLNSIGGANASICLYDSQKNFITGLKYGTQGVSQKQSVTIRSDINASYIRFSYFVGSNTTEPDDLSKIQIELGDKSTSYEPYREPITTPIYLSEPLQAGEVLRSDGSRDVKWGKFKIKDLTFAYESKDQRFSATVSNIYSDISIRKVRGFSDIYECLYNGESFDSSWDNKFYFACFSSNVNTTIFYIHDHRFDNVDDFIASVGEHEIYYPLAESTTETVTVPQIPTFDGTTVIDVDTTVPPAEMSIKYRR